MSCIALRVTIPPLILPGSAATWPASPTEGTSTWTVRNSTGQYLSAAYLVFPWTKGALSGDAWKVGLEPSVVGDFTDYVILTKKYGLESAYVAAVNLGDLDPDETASIKVHYRVKDDLIPAGGGNFFLPELTLQAIVVPVPEPGTLFLFAAGLVGLAAICRSRC
jgi:hypothetical protein